jgi:hypothetical protein
MGAVAELEDSELDSEVQSNTRGVASRVSAARQPGFAPGVDTLGSLGIAGDKRAGLQRSVSKAPFCDANNPTAGREEASIHAPQQPELRAATSAEIKSAAACLSMQRDDSLAGRA